MLIIGNGRMITRNPECTFIENGAVAIQDIYNSNGGYIGRSEKNLSRCGIH